MEEFRHFEEIEMNEAKWRLAIDTLYDMTPKRFSKYAEHSGGGKHSIGRYFHTYLTRDKFNKCMEMYMPEVKKVKIDDKGYYTYKMKTKDNFREILKVIEKGWYKDEILKKMEMEKEKKVEKEIDRIIGNSPFPTFNL